MLYQQCNVRDVKKSKPIRHRVTTVVPGIRKTFTDSKPPVGTFMSTSVTFSSAVAFAGKSIIRAAIFVRGFGCLPIQVEKRVQLGR